MNRTALLHPSYLARIKAAVLRAVRKAHTTDHPKRMSFVTVYNRRDKPSLLIVGRVGRSVEIFGGPDTDDDVTSEVMTALRAYHASLGV